MSGCGPFGIRGIEIGHAQDREAATGCTVVLAREGAMAGVCVRGGSPGTRETDALDPMNLRQSVHAVLLAGGSAFGLDAAGGVMRYLEERGVGRDVGVTVVPIVCGAILYDLRCRDWRVRPDQAMGYAACADAERRRGTEPGRGCVGAGTGCLVGKTRGTEYAMKGGFGHAVATAGPLRAAAAMAVNCVGDVVDPRTGAIAAGALNDDLASFADSEACLLSGYSDRTDFFSGNTIIGVVATNAKLGKAEANRLASVAHDGIARCVRPAHSVFDGDSIFALATGEVEAAPDAVAILAVRAVEAAILDAVRSACPCAGFRAASDFV